MNLNGSFGHWLKQRRAMLDLTQAELADQVGCATITIRKIEADERRPSKQISERMADVLAIALEERDAFLAFARRAPDPDLFDDLEVFVPVHDLPPQPTPFIGRERELAQIAGRLADPACRLLTLVGPGGIGKTRLALQAAADHMADYADGVFFVSLTPVGETTMIPAAIASAVRVSFYGQEPPGVQIVNYLRGKHLLLVLDNFEHLLGGIDLLADMLTQVPRLKLLVTSRERLNMREEWVLPLDGLPYPTQEEDDLSRYSAVQLFVQTAQRIQPGFSLDDNREGVIDICRVVEGMPLGLELAASWLRAMSCEQIAIQIQRDLDFLSTPLRNMAERHRSLRAVFEHSWGLLTEVERTVVMKLSVFRGGCDLEAAEQVAGADLQMLAGLVDKSLVRLNDQGRYEMHELVRQFAADKLLESGQADETRQRHLQYFLNLAEQLEPRMFGPQQIAVWDHVDVELDNVRAALTWASSNNDPESGLRLAGALGWFWNRRTHWIEGRSWLEKLLVLGSNASALSRAKAIHHLLELNAQLHDGKRVAMLCEEALTLASEVETPWPTAWLFCSLGFSLQHVVGSQPERRQAYLEKALGLFRTLGDAGGICEALVRLAGELREQGDSARADELYEEGIRLARQTGEKSILSWLLFWSANKHLDEGIFDGRTERIFQESLDLFRELRNDNGVEAALWQLGIIEQLRGRNDDARILFQRSLVISRKIGTRLGDAFCLSRLATIFCEQHEPGRGAQLLGAIEELVQVDLSSSPQAQKYAREQYEYALTVVHAHLDEATFATAFAEGQRMTLDEAVANALENSAVDGIRVLTRE